jgi:aminopeptidase N
MTWYPNNNTPTDKATYDIAVTVPDDMEAASNGVLESNTDNGNGTRTWNWVQTGQMAPFLSMVAIGQYNVYESTMTLSDGRELPIWDFIEPGLDDDDFADMRALQEEIILWGESKFGPYPGVAAGVLVADANVGYALETQDRPFFDGGIGESTLVHEIVHQWFGNDVSPSAWNDLWQSEGPASYYETVWASERYDEPTPNEFWFGEWDRRADTSSFWAIAPAALPGPASLFARLRPRSHDARKPASRPRRRRVR